VARAHNVTVRPGLRLLVAFVLLLAACGAPASKTVARDLPQVTVVASANDEVTVNVLELICQSCYEHIVAGCRSIEGVVSIDVDRKEKLITLHFDSSLTTRARVLAAVDEVVATI
jgi:copper chaperone CopZ